MGRVELLESDRATSVGEMPRGQLPNSFGLTLAASRSR